MNDNKKYQSNMWFGMGENYNLTLNIDTEVVSNIAKDILEKTGIGMPAIEKDIEEKQSALDKINEELKDVKWEDRSEEQRKSLRDAEKAVQEARKKKTELYETAADGNDVIPQIIDIGLLGAGKLKGENLFKFLKRSVGFIK
jgi:molecular chaperone HtpG